MIVYFIRLCSAITVLLVIQLCCSCYIIIKFSGSKLVRIVQHSPVQSSQAQSRLGVDIALDSGCCHVCHIFAHTLLQPILSLLIAKPGQDRPNQAMPGQSRPDQTRPDQTKPGQTRPDQTRPVHTVQYKTKVA